MLLLWETLDRVDVPQGVDTGDLRSSKQIPHEPSDIASQCLGRGCYACGVQFLWLVVVDEVQVASAAKNRGRVVQHGASSGTIAYAHVM